MPVHELDHAHHLKSAFPETRILVAIRLNLTQQTQGYNQAVPRCAPYAKLLAAVDASRYLLGLMTRTSVKVILEIRKCFMLAAVSPCPGSH